LIAALFLFLFGSGPIKGFAVTLTIGLIASLFTALYVTRAIFDLLIHLKILKSIRMLQIFPETKIDFISKRYFSFALSGFLVILGLVTFIKQGDKAYGIDFAGGQLQEYRFTKPVPAENLRTILKEINLNDAVIQQFSEHPENVIIRTTEDTYDKVVETLKNKLPDNHFETLRIERVGPVVGKLLRKRAVLAIAFALIGILVYVGFRFKHLDFAVGGVVALLHDVLIAAGLLLVFNRQIDLLIITALLTIAGYSINDTIVIYDRVRENLPKMRKVTLRDVINVSLNQTLSRTILTSAVTLIVVIVLYLMGGEILNNFAFCLLVGFIAGCYSTVFIASPIVLLWQKRSKITA